MPRLTIFLAICSLSFSPSVTLAEVALSIDATTAAPGTTSLVSIYAVGEVGDQASGFNLPLEFGSNGNGLPMGFRLNAEPLQNVIFPNFNLNMRQNDNWDFDGIANADGSDQPLDSGEPIKLLDLAFDISPDAEPGSALSIEIVEMFLLSFAPSDLAQPVNARATLTVTGEVKLVPGDCNGDGILDDRDLTCVCSDQTIDAFLTGTGLLSGDLDANGQVEFADFLVLSANFGKAANYTGGDIDCSGTVGFPDFLKLSANFGKTRTTNSTATAPEPTHNLYLLAATLLLLSRATAKTHNKT